MESILVLGAIIGMLVFFAWLAIQSKKEGAVHERERQQRQALEEAELANSIRRDVTRRGAADRLRASKWNTDNLSGGSTDPDEQRRSTDRLDGGTN